MFRQLEQLRSVLRGQDTHSSVVTTGGDPATVRGPCASFDDLAVSFE
jgi:hypothetical protein